MRTRTSGARSPATRSSVAATVVPSTNQVEPLPASLGSTPAASPSSVAPYGEPGLDLEGGARQVVGPLGRRPFVPGPVDPRRVHAERRHQQQVLAPFEGEGRDPLAYALDAGPAAHDAEGHVGTHAAGDLRIGAAPPSAAPRPRPPSHRRARRRPGCAWSRAPTPPVPRPPAPGRPGSPRGAAVRRPSYRAPRPR